MKQKYNDCFGIFCIFFASFFYLLSLFTVPAVDFLVKIQEVKAMEREDAVFECVLSNPFSKILWFGKNLPLEQGDKYDIEVSEDKLIHRLVVKDCMVVDKGIYSACAGIKSCNAWLVVEGRALNYTPTKEQTNRNNNDSCDESQKEQLETSSHTKCFLAI